MIGKILDASKRHQVLPRVMMIIMTYQYFVVTNWFMSITEPSNSQAALVSVVTGAMTGAFGLWLGSEGKHTDDGSKAK
jgi:hypothetical protein|tara:strand:+ start:112 stop:345 length:234 start_codon:yes stop_codon:yes gene_type:complete